MFNKTRLSNVTRKGAAWWIVFPAILVFFSVTVLYTPSSVSAANNTRSFYFPDVHIEAQIHEDGSMSVVEQRTFHFRGQYRGAWQYIYLNKGPSNPSVRDVTVSEAGLPYQQVSPGIQDIPDTFYVEHYPDYVYIDWSYLAENQERTFTISYIVDNAVVVHEDVAELYWQFIGDKWDKQTSFARVDLTLPTGAAIEDLRAWGHGPLHGNVNIESPSRVVWEITDLPANNFLEGRVAFPAELVPTATTRFGNKGLPQILAEEENWARKANLRRQLYRLDFFLGPLILLAVLFIYLVLRRRATRDPAAFDGDYFRELPGDYPPAEAGYLVRLGKTRPEDFTATLLDFSRRGHVRLEEYEGESGLISKKRFIDYRIFPSAGNDRLQVHEQELYNFIFHKVSTKNNEGVTFKEIENFAKKHPRTVQNFYTNWGLKIKNEAHAHKFFRKKTLKLLFFGLAIMFLAFLLLLTAQMYVTGILSFLSGLLLLVGGATLKNLTPMGADHYAKWKAFKRFLLHFSEMERALIPALEIWEHYLVYAVTLGVAKKVIQQLKLVYPQLNDTSYLATHTWTRIALMHPGQFENAASTMQQSFRAAFHSTTSSGSGRGGGFSGGGGRGGGGGGGGAR